MKGHRKDYPVTAFSYGLNIDAPASENDIVIGTGTSPATLSTDVSTATVDVSSAISAATALSSALSSAASLAAADPRARARARAGARTGAGRGRLAAPAERLAGVVIRIVTAPSLPSADGSGSSGRLGWRAVVSDGLAEG